MSFLQRRMAEQGRRDTPPEEQRPTPPAAEAPRPAAPPPAPVSAPVAAPHVEPVLERGASAVHKKRTSPKVAQLRRQFRSKLLAAPDETDAWVRADSDKEQMMIGRIKSIVQKANITLTAAEFEELKEGLLNDLLGFGAIEPLVQDKTVSEIMVTGADMIFAERKGKMSEVDIVFDDEEHVQWTAQRIVRPLQRSLNRENLITDARLPDGSRVHVVMPPSALKGTTITIRKFPSKPLMVEDLIRFGSFTQDVAQFLQACIVSRLNVVVSGGTGSGKTTLLNVLSSFIPEDERIITIEDSAELQLMQRHVVSLETTPPVQGAKDNEGRVVIRDLVKASLRMRPDRIVVGECRGGEALDMLQAMNTGHDGSLTTVHANNPRDALTRLETLCMMSGMDLPLFVIRQQVASAIHMIVQQSRLKDGSRKVVQISEIQGMEGPNITMQDLFVYRTPGQTGQGYSHAGGGALEGQGFRPNFEDKLKEHGFKLSANVFGSMGKFTKGQQP